MTLPLYLQSINDKRISPLDLQTVKDPVCLFSLKTMLYEFNRAYLVFKQALPKCVCTDVLAEDEVDGKI